MKAIGRLSEILESEVNSYGASSRLVPISLSMIIPKNICGFIVGKKGETIKELRVQSGAQIALAVEVNYSLKIDKNERSSACRNVTRERVK